MYAAEILAHSKPASWDGPDLMSALVTFPRVVLAEVVTHRAVSDVCGDFELSAGDRTTTKDISKNSASSRAIPLWKMIRAVWTDPYVPERFSAAGPGMQAAGWLEGDDHDLAKTAWLSARNAAIYHALIMSVEATVAEVFDRLPDVRTQFYRAQDGRLPKVGVHKQDVNRLLEPWAWVTQILTADGFGWNNFFALRCHKDAAPAFQKVARMVYLRYRESSPKPLEYGQWHLPFTTDADCYGFRWVPQVGVPLPDPIQFSAARCAWLSYSSHDKDGSADQMRATFARLMAGSPRHASPVEHQATPDAPPPDASLVWRSNLRGWIQARKLVVGERTDVFAPSADEIASWGLT